MKSYKTVLFLVTVLVFSCTLYGEDMPPFPPNDMDMHMGLTEFEEKVALEFIESIGPEKLKHLKMLKLENPKEYFEVLRHATKEKYHLDMLKEHDKKKYEMAMKEHTLDHKIHTMAEKFRQMEDEKEKLKIRKEMKTLLLDLFDIREARKMEEIRHLEKELQKLREISSERQKSKDKIIDRRLDELYGTPEIFEW